MKKIASLLLFMVVLSSVSAQNNGNTSIAMLNYLATETRLVVSSTNSRLVLEETYNKLINNTNPAVIDQDTKIFLETLLNSIEKFRILGVQRERLEYIFENQKSQAITQSLPNPLYLLGARDLNPLSLIATLAVMTVDSIFKFQGAVNNAEMSFLKDGWELDDKEAETLHKLRKDAFLYMRDVAVNNRLSMTDTLNEESIDNFVRYSLDENLQRRRQWLEDSRRLYAVYAPFWLALAETYYEIGLYRECIDAVTQYEAVQAQIFRQERDFARILPKVITAVSHVHGTSQTSVTLTQSYLQKLIQHTTDADWALRYFAAQAYIRMAGIGDRRANLTAAYNVLVGNVTHLSRVQENLLAKYIAPIDETIPRGTAKEKEKQMKSVINGLKNQRKKELPPMHEGLLLNYQTLLGIMDELNTPDQERNRINAIIDESIVYKMMRHSFFDESYDVVRTRQAYVTNTYLRLNDFPVVFLFPELKADIRITENNNSIETIIFLAIDVKCEITSNIRRRQETNIDSFNRHRSGRYYFNVDVYLRYNGSSIFNFQKEKDYFIYVTFYYRNIKYTLRFNQKAGDGSSFGSFDIIPPIGQIIDD